MTEKIETPVTFNAHKHHFRFLLKEIELWKNLDWKLIEPAILLMGENLTDFYTGFLTVENICTECRQYFLSIGVNDKAAFSKWLHPMEYRRIVLSDSSEWIIKEGKDSLNYIHIHPAKQSPHTIRVRASTLKTVVTLAVKNTIISKQTSEILQSVNLVRTTFLNLSPVKSLQADKGILKLWEMFANHHSATLPFS